ncbi:dTDP-4-dehydrorhamnose 3,5-epimerase family protein, partial [Candidatus Woesearchaeota archaeon]|nr:dTDP-4-dehydrorhamnose 3,5-epimerase family protein [Candidatus Woesearchaeota archaeon]
KELRLHSDDRGRVMELLRNDDPVFEGFGQVYITTCMPGFTKAWHLHRKQVDHFVCVKGSIRLGLFDPRESSRSKGQVQELVLGMEKPVLVKIPAGVYHGFECASDEESMVINIPSLPYNRASPDEFRKPFDSPDIPFRWNALKGG